MLVYSIIDGTADDQYNNERPSEIAECEWCGDVTETNMMTDTDEGSEHTLCRDCVSSYNMECPEEEVED